jgi:nitrogen regulatory protein PII
MNNIALLDRFVHELKDNQIKGATILNSTGMGRKLIESDDFDIIGSLKAVFEIPRTDSKVILMALEDVQIPTVLDIIDRLAGDLSKPNTGIVFTLPIDFVKGYKK